MAHLFVHRHVGVHPPGGRDVFVLHIFGQTQQNAHGELIVQEPAFDVSGGRDPGAGLEADDVPHLNPQIAGILRIFHVLVQHHLGGIEGTVGGSVIAVDVHRRVHQLQRAFHHPAVPGVHPHVFGFAVCRLHAAQSRQPQPAVGLHLRHHAAQGIRVGFQQQRVGFVPASQVDKHAALDGELRVVSHFGKGVFHPFRRPMGKTRGAVDGQQLYGLFHGVIRIFLVHK